MKSKLLHCLLALLCALTINAKQSANKVFTNYQIIDNSISINSNNNENIELDLGTFGSHNLNLNEKNFFSNNYNRTNASKHYAGKVANYPNSKVSLTINENFVMGFIEFNNEKIFIEPAHFYADIIQQNKLIIYQQRDVKPIKTNCAHQYVQANHNKINQNSEYNNAMAFCNDYELEIAIGADYLLYTDFGMNETDLFNFLEGIHNMSQPFYDNVFAANITLLLTEISIETSPNEFNLTSSLNATTFLNDLEVKKANVWNSIFDIGTFWTARDIFYIDDNGLEDSGIVGFARTRSICGPGALTVNENYTADIPSLVKTNVHEIGHVLGAEHDEVGSFIMDETASGDTWSSTSVNVINEKLDTEVCQCVNGPFEDLRVFCPPNVPFSAGGINYIQIITANLVANDGNVASEPTTYRGFLSTDDIVSADDTEILNLSIPSIEPSEFGGAQANVTLNLTQIASNLPNGTYYFLYQVEAGANEQNADNNVTSICGVLEVDNPITGCTDATACNYNPDATEDNGSCNPADCLDNCNGQETGPAIAGTACTINNQNGTWDANCMCIPGLEGCTNATACNYNPNAVNDDGSCNPTDCLDNCNGQETGPAITGTACTINNQNGTWDANCMCIPGLEGCTDATACNYNPNAVNDDGSCNPTDCLDNCNGQETGPAIAGTACTINNQDGTWDDNCACIPGLEGCTEATACNYNPNAVNDDGSCNPTDCLDNCNGQETGPAIAGTACTINNQNGTWDANCMCIPGLEGCTDATACNYNPDAVNDDGSCNPTDCLDNCNGQETGPAIAGTACTINNQNGTWDANCMCIPGLEGCTDATACNYNPDAVNDDGSCNPTDCLDNCNGQETGPAIAGTACTINNQDGTWDDNCMCIPGLAGCTDATACNYNPDAVNDDGSCNPTDCLDNCNGQETGPAIAGTTCTINNQNGTWDANCICIPGLEGCTDATACNYNPDAVNDDGSCNPTDCLDNCNGQETGPAIAGTACTINNQNGTWDANCMCIPGLEGCTDATACNYNPAAVNDDGSCNPTDCLDNCNGQETGPAIAGTACTINNQDGTWDDNCACIPGLAGCTDATACNYNPDAVNDDGSCNPTDCLDNCNGQETGPAITGTACTINNQDGTWDDNCMCIPGLAGCTDATACNYNPDAVNDDGSCNPTDCLDICNGQETGPAIAGTACTINNQDGTWDDNCMCIPGLEGCTDATACNYNPNAVNDDGSCNPTDCLDNCNGQETGPAIAGTACTINNQDGTWDDNCACIPGLFGCTDATACNYNPDAVNDDGSCNPTDCLDNCNGQETGPAIAGTSCTINNQNGTWDANCMCIPGLAGCTDATACNYNPDAVNDDGSCNPTDCLDNCNGQETGPAITGTACTINNQDGTWDDNCMCIPGLEGCTDATACNYNPDAVNDDGSCNPTDCLDNCNGQETGPAITGTACTINNQNGTWDDNCACIPGLFGCTDATACNYNPAAVNDDGSCNPTDCLDNCNGQETGPAIAGTACTINNQDGTWDDNCMCIPGLEGCTDATACNYNPNAVNDDGSCNPTDCLDNCNGQETGPAIAGTACNNQNGTWDDNCACIPGLEGCTDATACNYNPNAVNDDGSCNPTDCLDNCNGQETGPAIAGTACTINNQNGTWDDNCACIPGLAGCTDATACNYNPAAVNDDGSCNPTDCLDNCNGQETGPAIAGTACTINNQDGTWDDNCMCIPGLFGCTDATACNYNPAAVNDDGSCNPTDCLDNCNGQETGPAIAGTACTINNQDGTWDDNCICIPGLFGCTDVTACNYNPNAVNDDGSCMFENDPCTINGQQGTLNDQCDCIQSTAEVVCITTSINSNSDDIEESDYQGEMYQGSSDLEIGFDSYNNNDNQTLGLRFTNVDVPYGVDIDAAYIQFTSDEDWSGTTTALIGIENTTNATPWDVNNNFDVTSRSYTFANFAWNIPPWSENEISDDTKSIDISDIVQTVTSSFGWTENNAMAFAIDGQGRRAADSAESGNPAQLTICYIDVVLPSGCTDVTACNYDPNAFNDDGSCNLKDCAGICEGEETGPNTPGSPCLLNGEEGVWNNQCACILPSDCNKTETIEIAISHPNDDAEMVINDNNEMYFNSSDLEMTLDDGYKMSDQKIGVRFTNVNIPQGAEIKSSYIQFTADESDSQLTNLEIAIESTGNAVAYADVNGEIDFGNRDYDIEAIEWNNVPTWYKYDKGEDQQTPDLTAALQQVINRNDWSIGNAVSFLIFGTGKRVADSYECNIPSKRPTLVIEYCTNCPAAYTPCDDGNPNTINDVEDGNCNCAGEPVDVITVCYSTTSNNDVEQLAHGSIYFDSSDLEFHYDNNRGWQQTAIRFTNINVPQNAIVSEAKIQFKADETDYVQTYSNIYIENSGNSQPVQDVNYNISNRNWVNDSKSWHIPYWTTGQRDANTTTPDLSDLVQNIVDNNSWDAGNAMMFRFAGNGQRVAESANKGGGTPAELCITYQIDDHRNTLTTQNTELAIYPNPNRGEFVIEFDNLSLLTNHNQASIEIFNMAGQLVWNKMNAEAIENKLYCSTDDLSTGHYIVKVTVNERLYYDKLIIQYSQD